MSSRATRALIKLKQLIMISPPYIKCPNCGKNSFGVLIVNPHSYIRRCKDCHFPFKDSRSAVFPLPELSKKLIYIDQFAVSNMMKAINPKTRAHKKGSIDQFWQILFEKLYRLSNLQLIICPASSFHFQESFGTFLRSTQADVPVIESRCEFS
jgi:hypothetical protein